MRYLCKPAKGYYAPLVAPDGFEDEARAAAWAEHRAPGRGPWTVTPIAPVARPFTDAEVLKMVEDDTTAAMRHHLRLALDAHARAVITNDDPDYFQQLRRLEGGEF